jgi:hypothetical protein
LGNAELDQETADKERLSQMAKKRTPMQETIEFILAIRNRMIPIKYYRNLIINGALGIHRFKRRGSPVKSLNINWELYHISNY